MLIESFFFASLRTGRRGGELRLSSLSSSSAADPPSSFGIVRSSSSRSTTERSGESLGTSSRGSRSKGRRGEAVDEMAVERTRRDLNLATFPCNLPGIAIEREKDPLRISTLVIADRSPRVLSSQCALEAKRGREGERRSGQVRSFTSIFHLPPFLPSSLMAPPNESDLYAYSLLRKEKASISKEILTAPVVGRSSVANHMQLVRPVPFPPSVSFSFFFSVSFSLTYHSLALSDGCRGS